MFAMKRNQKRGNARLNKEVFVFIFRYHLKSSVTVSWCELLAMPVKQTIIVIIANLLLSVNL